MHVMLLFRSSVIHTGYAGDPYVVSFLILADWMTLEV